MMGIVGDEDDADVLLAHLQDRAQQGLRLPDTEGGRRLVENEKTTPAVQGTRDRERLLLAARQGPGRPEGVRDLDAQAG